MDDPLIGRRLVWDGFPGERLRVLARPVRQAALVSPITGRLLVTDVGYFPHALAHGRSRPRGSADAIVILAVAGCGYLRAGEDEWRVESGQAAVISPNTPHVYWADARDPWTIWWIHIDGTAVAELMDAIVTGDDAAVFPVRDLVKASELIDEILTKYEEEESSATITAGGGIAWHLLTQLAAQRLGGHPDHVDRIDLLRTYIRDNLTSTIRVEELASLVNLSPSHTASIFRSAVGTSITDYIKHQRSARARELLMTTSYSVTQIGRLVGYSDPLYFSRQFTSVNGVSPRAFRASR
ncbi:helix-turn-helix domain-containing protein [Tessaracoccus sp. G1721]